MSIDNTELVHQPIHSLADAKHAMLAVDPKDHRVLLLASGTEVTFGIPVSLENPEKMEIPYTPHVFMAEQVYLPDQAYPDIHIPINNVLVIFAHGHRVDNRWKFADGQDVVDTVQAFNRYSVSQGLEKIAMVIACNQSDGDQKLADRSSTLDSQGIIFAQAGLVYFIGSIHDRKGHITIRTPYGFTNVDSMYAKQHGESLIEHLRPTQERIRRGE